MYDIIALWTTTNRTKNENVPIKNSQKIADIKIEDTHHYIAEVVENSKISDLWKNYRPISVGVLDSYDVNIWAMMIKLYDQDNH